LFPLLSRSFLVWGNLFVIFVFVSCTFGIIFKKILAHSTVLNNCLCFLLVDSQFQMLYSSFTPLWIYFIWWETGFNFIFLYEDIQFSKHQLLKRLCLLTALWKITGRIGGLLLGSQFWSLYL
jgi:hypothetical protein